MASLFAVTLEFETKEARDFFMGGLSDGFGEDNCHLKWDGDFDTAQVFRVVPYDLDGGYVGSPAFSALVESEDALAKGNTDE